MTRVRPHGSHRQRSALRRGVAGALAVTGALWIVGCQRTAPPNIILYVVDTLRFDALHCNGNLGVHTPAMDRVATEGLRFTRAYANASWTRPSMASLLTGSYPRVHGAVGRQDPLRPGLRLLAGMLRGAGYRTAAIFVNPNVSGAYGFADGFDDFVFIQPPKVASSGGAGADRPGRANHVIDRAIEWLRGRQHSPFFLLVFTVDPHAPYEPPPPYDTMYDPSYTGSIDGSFATLYRLLSATRLGSPPAERDVRHLRALYDGGVAFNDAQLSRLLAELDHTGLTSTTLFAITADHGEEFYEHGYGDHGHSLYDELIHVPLIVRWPGHITAQQTYNGAVQLIDLYPTLLRLAGITPPPGPGRDLSAILLGRSNSGIASLVYAEERLDDHNLRAVILDQQKVILDAAHPEPLNFDLSTDPGEQHPRPGIPQYALTAAMSDIENANRSAAEARPLVVTPPQLSESERQAMDALGYGAPARP